MTDVTRPSDDQRPGLLEQDNYGVAVAVAATELAAREVSRLALLPGVTRAADGRLQLTFFGERVLVQPGRWTVSGPDGDAVPVWEHILVLHYLLGADHLGADEDRRWLAYRELPEASFFAAAFTRQVCKPLAARFGEAPEQLTALVGRWQTTAGDTGDGSLQFEPLPGLHLLLVIWAGDKDFPAEGNVLINRAVGRCLTAEDAAVLADVALRRVLSA